MKTDKKKLMRKLIVVGLMASMLATNTMTYGSDLILPGINAEALTISEAEAKTIDISALAQDFVATQENGGVIRINIDENGTYKFTGTNYKNAGSCYIDVQVTVPAGVTADFIFDNCTILNNCEIPDCGSKVYPEEAFVINGTVNIYVKNTSKIAAFDIDYQNETVAEDVITFTGSGTVNVMESEDKDQWLKISEINTSSLNVYGGNLSTNVVKSANFKTTDGMVFSNYWDNFFYFMRSTSITYEGGNVCGQNAKYGFYILPENGVQLTDINGIKQEHAYLSNDGMLYTYHDEEFSAGNAPYIVAGGELFVFTDFGDQYFDTPVSLGAPAALDNLKITKEYDGTAGLGNQTIEPITMGNYTLTPDLSAVNLKGSDVGEYTATVPFKFTKDETEYTFKYEVDVEITAAPLTVSSVTVEDKGYDGKTDATVTAIEFDGLVGTDALVLGTDYTATAAFEDEKIGTDKTVNVTVALADTVKNYALETGAVTAKADITVKELTIKSVTVEDKVYDGKTTATVKDVVFEGLADTDKLVLGTDYTVTAAFADEKIGKDKTVNVTVTLADTVTNYALETGTVTTKASIIEGSVSGTANNGAGTFTYESVDPVSPLVKAEGEPAGSDFMIIEKDQSQTTTTYYFVYKAKLTDLAGKSTGTVHIALSEDGEQTRKFTTNDIFESVTIEGKKYTPPDGYLYFVYAVSDVPNTEQLFCSAKVQLS